jgi:type IV pilus assembly protein PilV
VWHGQRAQLLNENSFYEQRIELIGICMTRSLRRKQQGVGLIEVMVTVLILGTSLLAIAALQSRSLTQNHGAFLATKANIIAYDLIDRVRLRNAGPESTRALAVPLDDEIKGATESSLPSGAATVVCDAARLCTVTINWAENKGKNTADDGATSTFIYTTSL